MLDSIDFSPSLEGREEEQTVKYQVALNALGFQVDLKQRP
jgi:hypothetical protein